MELELVSFKICPYVQRSRITMLQKGVDHKVTYIDLADPPAWFKEASPLGKVPIIRVKDAGTETVLFESAVINEFVDEISDEAGRLMPADPVRRAQTRAWIEFGSECLQSFFLSTTATDEEGHVQHLKQLKEHLRRLDAQVEGPYFCGETFTLADAALAPLLMRLTWFAQHADFDLEDFPKLHAWWTTLSTLPSVVDSIVPEWQALHDDYARSSGAFIARAMPLETPV